MVFHSIANLPVNHGLVNQLYMSTKMLQQKLYRESLFPTQHAKVFPHKSFAAYSKSCILIILIMCTYVEYYNSDITVFITIKTFITKITQLYNSINKYQPLLKYTTKHCLYIILSQQYMYLLHSYVTHYVLLCTVSSKNTLQLLVQ